MRLSAVEIFIIPFGKWLRKVRFCRAECTLFWAQLAFYYQSEEQEQDNCQHTEADGSIVGEGRNRMCGTKKMPHQSFCELHVN